MPRTCGCADGYCRPSSAELTRREFLRSLGVGAVALWGGSLAARAAAPAPVGVVPSGRSYSRYPLTSPRVYEGVNLGAVAMPIGGIGTGTIWLDGQGRLRVWQIHNNYSEPRIPCSFLGMRVKAGADAPQVRVLQTEPEDGFAACRSLAFEGGYPVARLRFDTGTPVSVTVEAFNPLIPTDTDNSSLPCAIFRVTAKNEGTAPAEVTLLSTLQNAVGLDGNVGIDGVSSDYYGSNRNRIVRADGLTAISMTVPAEPPAPGFLRARTATGRAGSKPILYIERLASPEETATAGMQAVNQIEALASLSAQDAVIVAAGAATGFFTSLERVQDLVKGMDSLEVFEDFEKPSYEGWTVQGEGFGPGPSHGTEAGQQAVSGFLGGGLVNTFRPGDSPKGRMLSKPFTIHRRYIGFLVGGGQHPDETCINLLVDGKVVRTSTGRNQELLLPESWDVGEFQGKEARIEIVDQNSGGWGHVNIDEIVMSDIEPDRLLRLLVPLGGIAPMLALKYTSVATADAGGAEAVAVEGAWPGADALPAWHVGEYVKLEDLRTAGLTVLATTASGDPLIVRVPFGGAALFISLATRTPWDWVRELVVSGAALPRDATLETTQSGWGSMALATTGARAGADPRWTDSGALATVLRDSGTVSGPRSSGPSETGRTYNGALAVPFTLAPGEERAVPFVIAWHFPNAERMGHEGNYYCEQFPDALAAARYVVANLDGLTDRTLAYHRTVYQSNLPEEFIDAVTSQSVIVRGPTCWRDASGYFGGWEGCYACCPLNCTHVWNYAQSHARLFPEIGRNMRVSNFVTWLHPDGETSHREYPGVGAFADGHCACIEAALREHQLSPDDEFLRQVYPGVKRAMEWFIGRYDAKEEGATRTQQWNTYDTAVSGLNTFIGSQYLSALESAATLADAAGDDFSARRWRELRRKGSEFQDSQLWGGSYYIQIPETPPASDYNNGCHSDQLLGQWWAHMNGLGYLYPSARVKRACESIYEHNYKPDFAGLEQTPRRYIDDGDGGLYMCTWPGGDRPDPYTLYSVEVWTGVEYSTAGLLIYEGLIDEARAIVKTARARYDGRPRKDLNSGGGVCGMGNPYQELECGKFYARAMSAGGLLVASQGLVLDCPAGVLGFKPNWQPEDHRSFFTVADGWGLFCQERQSPERQVERIELRYGKARLRELVFQAPDGKQPTSVEVWLKGRKVDATFETADDGEIRIAVRSDLDLSEGDTLEVAINLA